MSPDVATGASGEARSFTLVGPGRAGLSLESALVANGWSCRRVLKAGDDLADAGANVKAVFIATPDRDIESVAAAIDPQPATVVVHLAGSVGLDVLRPHARRAALHPLVSLPSAEVGAERLTSGVWFAVAGSTGEEFALMSDIVAMFNGTVLEVADADRAAYHAAACIASNHLVALLGQVERIAEPLGVPLEAFLPLVESTVDSVRELGAEAALTGPVMRDDWMTVARHLDVLDQSEQQAYVALAALAWRLAHPEEPGSAVPFLGEQSASTSQLFEGPENPVRGPFA